MVDEDTRATVSDPNAFHVSAENGERPGFDPRMNDFAFEFTFLDDPLAQVSLDVDRVSADILTLARADDFTVDLRTSGALPGARATIIATPAQSFTELDDTGRRRWGTTRNDRVVNPEGRTMLLAERFTTAGLAAMLASCLVVSAGPAQEFDFTERHKAVKQRFEKNKGKARNKAVHEPPMIKAETSDLGDNEPVIGVYLNDEARAYPLTMLFGGGGIFELLNDTCGGQPIAASW